MSSKESTTCKTCGDNFLFYRSTLRGKDASFCSRKCIKLVAHNKGKIEWKKCDCGKAIRKWNKYCGKSCLQKYSNPTSHLPEPRYGQDNPAWKGGVTPENLKIRHSREYTVWRVAVMVRDDYTCQSCGVRGGKLQVDHIKPFAFYPKLRLAIDNGRTLCVDCHRQTDTWGYRSNRLFAEGGLN